MTTHETKSKCDGQKSCETEPLILPPIIDKPSALAALNEVVQALGAGRIKCSVADTLLSCIKLANRLLTEIAEAGLSVYPIQQPTLRPYAPAINKPQSAARNPNGQGSARLATSHDPRTGTVAFDPTFPSNDRLVEQMMAQVHEQLDKDPAKNPLFRRVHSSPRV